jgi:hypothetical protein
MDIFIQNSTDDDATVKVYPSGPPPKEDKPPKSPAAKEIIVSVKANSTKKISAVPASFVVHFAVPVEVCKYEVKPPTASIATAPKRLTLTKVINDGYKVLMDTQK